MNAREELEIRGIIDKNGKHINEPCPYHPEGQECANCEGTGLIYKGTIVDREQLAQAILDWHKAERIKWALELREDSEKRMIDKLPELGFVRLEDVEIDAGVIDEVIKDYAQKYLIGLDHQNSFRKDASFLAFTIKKAKGIIRVKEGK